VVRKLEQVVPEETEGSEDTPLMATPQRPTDMLRASSSTPTLQPKKSVSPESNMATPRATASEPDTTHTEVPKEVPEAAEAPKEMAKEAPAVAKEAPEAAKEAPEAAKEALEALEEERMEPPKEEYRDPLKEAHREPPKEARRESKEAHMESPKEAFPTSNPTYSRPSPPTNSSLPLSLSIGRPQPPTNSITSPIADLLPDLEVIPESSPPMRSPASNSLISPLDDLPPSLMIRKPSLNTSPTSPTGGEVNKFAGQTNGKSEVQAVSQGIAESPIVDQTYAPPGTAR
jgi:hypothetical protein